VSSKYNLLAVPVATSINRIQGIVTVDDIMARVMPARAADTAAADLLGLLSQPKRQGQGPLGLSAAGARALLMPPVRHRTGRQSPATRTTMPPRHWLHTGGSQFGYDMLWVLLVNGDLPRPIMEMVARMGVVTGKGLSDLIRERFG